MSIKVNKIEEFKDMGFRIEENVNHVAEVNHLVLDDVSLADLNSGSYTTETGYTIYDVATTNYTILKKSEYVPGYEAASMEDVISFIENEEYKKI